MDQDRRQDRAPVTETAGRIRATARAAGARLIYFRDGQEIAEYAPAGDLGEIQIGAPVEIGHGGPVVGKVAGVFRSASELIVDLDIPDEAIRRDVGPGRRYPHVSADYRVGRVDSDGAQRGVTIAAIALVPKGRCGDSCAVRQDCAGALECSCYADRVTKIKIAGKEYTAGSPEAAAAMEIEGKRLDAASAVLRAEESKALRAKVESAFPDITIRKDAPDQEILIETVKKIAPGVDLSSASPDYVAGAFAVAIAMALDLKGKADEPGPDDAPAQDAAPPKPPVAAGASAVRADVFQARTAAKPAAPAKRIAPALSPSEKAHADMIARGRGRRPSA
jgi:hypothetical protein